jgi:hypothetical protein
VPLPLLFPGIPGGPELLVLALMSVFLVVPVVLIAGAYMLGKRHGRAESTDEATDERVE